MLLTFNSSLMIESKLEHFDKVTSYDIVELNPLRDVSRKTEQIALNILAKTINKINELEDKEIEEPLY